jgi:mycothiol synthase
MITIRTAVTDAELEDWLDVRRRVLPNESTPSVEQMKALAAPRRLVLLADLDGRLAGSGLADRSDTGDGFVAPRVLLELRRHGLGSALLERLLEHVRAEGFGAAGAHADDEGSIAFAHRHGFVEIDREVEQVCAVGDCVEPGPVEGVEFTTVAARPELLEAAYPLARRGYADMVLAQGTVEVEREAWLRDEATLPAGSFVALAGDRIVGYAGLLAWNGDSERAENGLTVVDRDWRRRGLATALKQRQLAWAAANGIREVVTWTQTGNEGMRIVNAGLGYITRSVSLRMRRELG